MAGPVVRFHLPSPPLRPYISSYYFTEVTEAPIGDLLTPEWANLRFVLSGRWTVRFVRSGAVADRGSALFGPTSQAVEVRCEAPGATLGVGLLPLGWTQLLSAPAHAFADRCARLEAGAMGDFAALEAAIARASSDEDRVAAVDAHFRSRLVRQPTPTPLLLRAHESLMDPATRTARDFAAGLGVSERHAVRLAQDMFGFAPKLLLRRQRFLRTLAVISADPKTVWGDRLDDGYFDQSHFVRDFKWFMGCTPTTYFERPRPIISAAARARQAMLGAGYQGLHPPRAAG